MNFLIIILIYLELRMRTSAKLQVHNRIDMFFFFSRCLFSNKISFKKFMHWIVLFCSFCFRIISIKHRMMTRYRHIDVSFFLFYACSFFRYFYNLKIRFCLSTSSNITFNILLFTKKYMIFLLNIHSFRSFFPLFHNTNT